MEFIVRISPDGKEVIMLYHDDSPLAGMGHKQVVRASNVRFDEDDQLWYIWLKHATGAETRLEPGFEKRKLAIEHEIRTLEKKLSTKDTKYFKELFNERLDM